MLFVQMENFGSSRPVINTSISSGSSFHPYLRLGRLRSLLLGIETVLGLPAWLLIAVTEYVHSAALGWVMFVSIFCWVLTVVLLLLYLAKALTRMPQLPWDTATLVFNCSAALVYAVAGVVEATLVASSKEEDSYSAWAASTVCVFLVSLSYACSSILSLRSWRAMQDGGEGG
ncbi:CKLF-like MARVEL transmembrane domain-containing protein 8 isoform X1 [Denticeps clupeoides]|uniref:CKLF-like MARVEL transmembrane domain-containing protein 8 isoform X1 n=2 Tax=Denticeps clupeoides TaxID=299321 RepID=UPI0010A45F0A|nr:CKLF-like MARVEL transmembrane domain-containing protein 8 isoform X1 [Denticeps clupeoides]